MAQVSNYEFLEVLDYKELSRIGKNVKIDGIIKKAKAICEARIQNAQPLNQAKEEVLSGLDGVLKSISHVRGIAGNFTQDKDLPGKIDAVCDKLLQAIPEFKKSVEILCSRMNEGKIRIVSIGEKSQGKSLFTQIYTQIPDASPILKVKAPNNTDDCTGAVNTFYHKDGFSDPLIEVNFLDLERVVSIIKSYVAIIQEKYPNWTIDGINCISTKEDLKRIINNQNLAKINALVDIKTDVKKGLKQYFSHGSGYVDKLGNHTISISEDEICQYNDMQNEKAFYLAVDHIDITMDLQMNGLFKYFEIADTKGASLQAGTLANKDIYDIIEASDAVFSISKVNQNQTWKFYNEFLGFQYCGNPIFRDKHFAICNIDKGYDNSNAAEGFEVLNDQRLANYCYVGRLKEDIETDNCKPFEFVKNLIVHMLDSIANNITKFDNERIKICCESGNIIRDSLAELRNLTDDSKINLEPFDERKLVVRKIMEFCKKATDYIGIQLSQIEPKNDDYNYYDAEEDYDLYYKEVTKNDDIRRYASLYQVLTGDKYPGKIPASFDEEEDKELSDAVKEILSSVRERHEVTENMNTAVHIGQYVDILTAITKEDIVPRLYERRIQHPISLKKREEVYNELWSIFSLDKIFLNSEGWNCECVERTDSLRKLNIPYNEGIMESFQGQDLIYNSYAILKEYFSLLRDRDEEDNKNLSILCGKLDEDLLHKTFVNEIRKLKIRESIIERIKTYPDALEHFYKHVATQIEAINEEISTGKVDSFYLSNVGVIASDDDRKKLLLAKSWEQFNASLSTMRQYEFKNLPLIQISSVEL